MDVYVLKRICISTKARHDAIASGASEEEANTAYNNAVSGTELPFNGFTSINHLTVNRELNDLLYAYFKAVDVYRATNTSTAYDDVKDAYDMFHTYRAMSTDTELLIFPMCQP